MKSPLNRGGLRFYLVLLSLGVGTLLVHATTPRSILAGLSPLLLGVCLHTWAKGCLRQNRVVAQIGPYRFVRHPFYLANALIDAGLVVMGGYLPLAIALPAWWLAIYLPVIRGEERYLSEKFPAEYSDYRRRVPCLVPWRRALPYAGDGFRWNNPNIAGGEELPRAVRILAYPLLFFVAQGLVAQGTLTGRFEWLREGWNLTALVGLLTLYIFAWQLHRHQRERRHVLPRVLERPIFRAALAAAMLAAVACVEGPKTACRDLVPETGCVLLLLSIPIYSRRPARAIAAEALALLGAIAASELLWLAPPVAAVYAAWILDRLLLNSEPPETSDNLPPPPYSWPHLYPLLALACAASIYIKLAGRIVPRYF